MATRTEVAQCMLCEALCGLQVEHDGTTVTKVRGDAQHPFSRGHICPKGVALQDFQNDRDRLRQPLRTVDGRFEPIGWDEAFALAGRRLAEIQARGGRDALALYFGIPAAHSDSAILYYPLLVAAAGTRNRFSAASIDTLPRFLAPLA